MSLKRGWLFAVSAVAVMVSLSSASAYVPSICDQPYYDCMYAVNNEWDEHTRQIMMEQCVAAYDTCVLSQNPICGDGYCQQQIGENCSSCFNDCNYANTSDQGTVTRNCAVVADAVYPDFLAGGIQQGDYCYYRVYQDYVSMCETYRITGTYYSCGNPPYSTQETYEGVTKSFHSRTQVGWEPRFGRCR